MAPPLSLTMEEADEGFEMLAQAVSQVLDKGPQ
jgi:4-aminobutyrate aminotransferase-like enzyme